MSEVASHFDALANDYDGYKKKNWYYYQNLKSLYQKLIPANNAVLEIGCGTGDILSAVNPSRGLGIDISPKMIELAQVKYQNQSNLKFSATNIENLLSSENFDYIFLCDVIEHLENPETTFINIKKFSQPQTKIIISMANPIWEPLLMLLEKLHLKMPEGPHYRLTNKELKRLYTKHGYTLLTKGYCQLLPAYLPFFSNFINRIFTKIPLIKKLGLTEYLILKIS